MELKYLVSRVLIVVLMISTLSSGLIFADSNQPMTRYMVYYESEQTDVQTDRQPTDGEIIINDSISVVVDTRSNIKLRFSDKALKRIEEDSFVKLSNLELPIGQLETMLADYVAVDRAGMKIALIDSGVDADEVALAGGQSFVPATSYDTDENGHGTALAKQIIGYVLRDDAGLQEQAELYSLKVLDQDGQGYYSSVIRALDWAENNQMDIVIIAFDADDYSTVLGERLDAVATQSMALLSLGDYSGVWRRPLDVTYAIPKMDASRLTAEQQEANALYIYQQLTERGWSKQAIAGLLGNIQQESHLNPGVWQVQNNTRLGYGLVQWDDGADFLNWQEGVVKNRPISIAEVNQLAVDDPTTLIDMQLEYLIWSSNTDTHNLARRWFPTFGYGSPYKITYESYINSTADVAELTLVFHASYERSSDNITRLYNRIAYAEKWYQFLLAQ